MVDSFPGFERFELPNEAKDQTGNLPVSKGRFSRSALRQEIG